MRDSEDLLIETLDLQDERTSANGRCVVFMRQAYPNMAVMTYDNQVGRGAEHLLLLKFVVGIGADRRILSYEYCLEETVANNVPGGLVSVAKTVDGHVVKTSIYPVMLGDVDEYRGAAVIHIKSDCNGIFVRFGSGNIAFMHHSPNKAMKGASIDCEEGSAALSDGAVVIRRNGRDFVTFVRGNAYFSICHKESGGSFAECFSDSDELWLTVGFAFDDDSANALSKLSPEDEILKIQNFYKSKFENLYIDTPDKNLNDAFMHAYLNLEYSWLYPLGWIECIQHWPTMFHMEQSAAEEWAGNSLRTKETLRSQLMHMQENGCIIELNPNHTARKDWGGDNHFFIRELLHYLKMTGDIDFAIECEPYMEKIIKQTFGEYDAIRSGILAWHTQIGNQEDFESTPGRGAAPGSEGVQMLNLLSEFYDILGHEDKKNAYKAASEYCLNEWKKRIWKDDLGRAIWFSDDYFEDRLDTTYHGICYPIIYGQVDSFDAKSSIDHLIHRMTGPEGEVFQSNHFGDHRYDFVPTWGMQAGSNMQLFATAAYSKLGMHEEAIRPLDFVANRVCGDYQRGSFPETANEKRFGYFSPSAGVYVQGVVENIFGVERNRFNNTTTISPCFPSDWKTAEMVLPDFSYSYKKDGNSIKLAIDSFDVTEKKLVFRTDFVKNVKVVANGMTVPATTTYKCGFCEIEANLGADRVVDAYITFEPLAVFVNYDKIAVLGEYPNIDVNGGKLIRIVDRCKIFDENGAYRKDLMDEYEGYGDFGLVNFARRTFAVIVKCDEIELTIPCNVTVLPQYFIQAKKCNKSVLITVKNNSTKSINEDAYLLASGKIYKSHVNCEPKGVACFSFEAKTNVPGKNRAMLNIVNVWSGEIIIESEIEGELEQIVIPEEKTVEYRSWRDFAYFSHHGCTVINPDAFLKGVPDEIEVGGVKFSLNGRFAPIATRFNRVLELPVNRKCRKLFVLFSAFADDHEICTELFDVEIECEKGDAYMPPLYKKTLRFPGDLDYGFGADVDAGFSTFINGVERPSKLPEFGNEDYMDTQPPLYPKRDIWCKNHAKEAGNAVFNLLEFDIGEERDIKKMTIIAKASDAAGGVFGICIY